MAKNEPTEIVVPESKGAMIFNVTIKGISPMLVNRFTEERAAAATSGTRDNTADERSPREQAETCLYFAPNDAARKHPVIPGPNFLRGIVDAGKFFKVGKCAVTTQKTSMVTAFVSIMQIEIPIISKEPWSVDIRPIRNPTTGGRINRLRPRFDEWEMKFSIRLDAGPITQKLLRNIIDAMGIRIGCGDFRPLCKGPFGKFVITHWELVREERQEAA
jgi:hypothetical protein